MRPLQKTLLGSVVLHTRPSVGGHSWGAMQRLPGKGAGQKEEGGEHLGKDLGRGRGYDLEGHTGRSKKNTKYPVHTEFLTVVFVGVKAGNTSFLCLLLGTRE